MVFECGWCESRDFYTTEARLIHLKETCTSPYLIPLQTYVAEAKRKFQIPDFGVMTIMLLGARIEFAKAEAEAEVEPLVVAGAQVEQRPVANAGRAARRRRRRAAAAAARRAQQADDQFSRLPYEIVVEIINKIVDLKTLFILRLVSKRFSSMVKKANTVSVSIHDDKNLYDSSKFCFLKKFSKVKSLCIQLPKLSKLVSRTYGCLFKWKIKFINNRLDSFVFFSPNSVYNTNTDTVNRGSMPNVIIRPNKYEISLKLLLLATDWLVLLGNLAKNFPLLEYVCVTDFDKEGTVSVNGGGKISQLKNIVSDKTEIEEKLHLCNKLCRISWYHVREVSVSGGYIMKGITMILIKRADLPNDSFMSFFDDDVKGTRINQEDKEEAAYHEAMMKVFMNNRHPKLLID